MSFADNYKGGMKSKLPAPKLTPIAGEILSPELQERRELTIAKDQSMALLRILTLPESGEGVNELLLTVHADGSVDHVYYPNDDLRMSHKFEAGSADALRFQKMVQDEAKKQGKQWFFTAAALKARRPRKLAAAANRLGK